MPINQHYKPLGFAQYYNYHAHQHSSMPLLTQAYQWKNIPEPQPVPHQYYPNIEEQFNYDKPKLAWNLQTENNSGGTGTTDHNNVGSIRQGVNSNTFVKSNMAFAHEGGSCCGGNGITSSTTNDNNGKWYWLPTPNKEPERPVLASANPSQIPTITEDHWKYILKNNQLKMVTKKPVEQNTFEPFKAIYNHFKEKIPFPFDGMTNTKSQTKSPFSYDGENNNNEAKETPLVPSDHTNYFINNGQDVHQPPEETYITEAEWTQFQTKEQEKQNTDSEKGGGGEQPNKGEITAKGKK